MSTSQSLRVKCKEHPDGSISLEDIIKSFNSSIREEHAWALCYQCARFFIQSHARSSESNCYLVSDINQVFLQMDGRIHAKTNAKLDHETTRKQVTKQVEVIEGLGLVIYTALDHGCNETEERIISTDLEELLNDMIVQDQSVLHETDDEGIERDSEDSFAESASRQKAQITLEIIVERCEQHLGNLSKAEVESHYCAVVKAFVTEGMELSSFLESVAAGGLNNIEDSDSTRDLEQLQFSDWARLWVQVLAELRKGFTLKKVNYTKAPVEYELTPYEILMKDIRSCRYTLRKIMINENVPKVTKDARAIILEFIRSRPPLKKASDRKLPPRQFTYTPREQLMNSIRTGRKLRKIKQPSSPTLKTRLQLTTNNTSAHNRGQRLIKLDLSLLDDDEDSDSDSWNPENQERAPTLPPPSALDAYDLACNNKNGPQTRRHSLGVYQLGANLGTQSVPQSRPCSRQSCASSENDFNAPLPLAPDLAQVLQDPTKPLDEATTLELTLEEIVHIRTVLTKAELEALPVEGHVRGDVENRKVCFLCLKTRFGLLGPWGHRCALCKRTVCSKCYSRMNIPMEHYSTIPVALLSPSLMCTPDEEYPNVLLRSTNSAKSSPQASPSRASPIYTDRYKNKAMMNRGGNKMANKGGGSQKIVCHDCRLMVLRIVKSGQANRSAIRNKHLKNLTLNLDPVFPRNAYN